MGESRDLTDAENALARAALKEFKHRDAKKKPDEQLGALIGLDQSSVNKFLHGKTGISYQTAQRLADLLERDVEELLGRPKRKRESDERYDAVIDAAVLELAKHSDTEITPEDIAVARRELWTKAPTVEDAIGRLLKAAHDRRAGAKPPAPDPLKPVDLRGRVWLARHSLPRSSNGKPPSNRSIAAEQPFVEKQINKLLTDIASGAKLALRDVDVGPLAAALKVAPAWLQHGTGEAPQPTGPMEPQPAPKYKQLDIVAMATNEQGDLDVTRLLRKDSFQAAIHEGYADMLKDSVVDEIKAKHFNPANPADKTLDAWWIIFRQAHTDPSNLRRPGSRTKRRSDVVRAQLAAGGL